MTVVSPPVFTDSVNQQFFIEGQGGPQHPIDYLDAFPETLYTKSIDSVLVTFLYALLGPVGVGQLRKAYLEARLQFEDAGLSTANLDALYTSPFAFARLAAETYEIDASASLLSTQDRAKIVAGDASFRNRAVNFFKGVRAGGTVQGLTLVAKSGLNHPVELVENYRALYDRYSDRPLNIPLLGTTTNLNEVVVLPRQDIPENSQQTLVITGEPTSGWFTLTLPLGAPYQVIPISTTSGSNVITVPSVISFPSGVYVSVTNVAPTTPIGLTTPTTYAQASSALTPTTLNLVYPPTAGANAGLPITMPSTGSFWAYVGNAETVPLPFNGSAITVQNALQGLPLIGNSDVIVTGGPLPDQPVHIEFVKGLGDQTIPALQVNLAPGSPPINGITGPSTSVPQMTDATNSPVNISASLTVDVTGISADQQTGALDPASEHAMQVALDQVRPMTSFFTTQPASSTVQRLSSNAIYTGEPYTEVLRYETGNASVAWPPSDPMHWVESGVEREAPRPVGDKQHQYQGFHNISGVVAYTEAALADPNYSSPVNPLWVTYWDTHMGTFSETQVALYPFLGNFSDTHAQFSPNLAVAVSPDPLIITDTVSQTGVINSVYPVDYLSLAGVPQLPTSASFWASSERIANTSGALSVDYLEIDLGTTQAVNYVYLEATNKPYSITVDYDTADQAPVRHFTSVTLVPAAVSPSTSILTYDATNTNPWSTIEIHCCNNLRQMIYTRYIRIGFTRTPAHTPFLPDSGSPVPYSIEIRNLRIGRNVSSPLDRFLSGNLGVMNTTPIPDLTLFPSISLFP